MFQDTAPMAKMKSSEMKSPPGDQLPPGRVESSAAMPTLESRTRSSLLARPFMSIPRNSPPNGRGISSMSLSSSWPSRGAGAGTSSASMCWPWKRPRMLSISPLFPWVCAPGRTPGVFWYRAISSRSLNE